MQKLKISLIRLLPKNTLKKIRKIKSKFELIRGFTYHIIKIKSNKKYYLKFFGGTESKNTIDNPNISTSESEMRWARAFDFYRSRENEKIALHLVWADGPIPGNFGDWLSPYIISSLSGRAIKWCGECENFGSVHYIGIGSIITSANKYSRVLGAGITSASDKVDVSADFCSVRGPYTAKRILELGGSIVNNYGDLGFIMDRVYQPKKERANNGVIIVRHINDANKKIILPEGYREISICAAHPSQIEEFIDQLHTARIVYTSAMHCFIVCQSYGIPCILFQVRLGSKESMVPGDGVKYLDAMAGADLPEIPPFVLKSYQQIVELENLTQPFPENISNAVKDRIYRNAKLALGTNSEISA